MKSKSVRGRKREYKKKTICMRLRYQSFVMAVNKTVRVIIDVKSSF